MKLIPIDFEYRGTTEAILDLICCSMEVDGVIESYWLHNDNAAKDRLKDRLIELRDDPAYGFICFNGDAEGSSFIALGLDPSKFKMVDLKIEWHMITNEYDKFAYGKQLINGKEVFTYRSLPYEDKDPKKNYSENENNLSACLYKLVNVKIDTDHKEEMRKICIYGTAKELIDNKSDIMNYCESDIVHLVPAFSVIRKEYIRLGIFNRKEILWRGETSMRVAMMSRAGYPVNTEWVYNFYNNTDYIYNELIEDINSQFPDTPLFSLKYKTMPHRGYKMNTRVVQDYIRSLPEAKVWPKTKTGKFSTEGDVLKKYWQFKHDYPRGNFAAQYMRYNNTHKSIKGMSKKADTGKTPPFHTHVGSDGRARPWLSPYGGKTGRYQPKESGFLFLKSSWLRSMVMPTKDKAIIGIDYSSQEFLVTALMSKDKNMLEAYASGDVYLYFAKLAGAVPKNGTKDEYKKERDLFKAVTLSMQYGMGAKGLALSLSQKMNKKITKEEAQDYINKYHKAYPTNYRYAEDIKYRYRSGCMITLNDGWTMFEDNHNLLSAGNFPVQGMGGCILRKAIQLCQDAGITVLYPLHDALYCEIDIDKLHLVDKMDTLMKDAFAYWFDKDMKKIARNLIRTDIDIWSPGFEEGQNLITPEGKKLNAYNIYKDPRGIDELNRFMKYMTNKYFIDEEVLDLL